MKVIHYHGKTSGSLYNATLLFKIVEKLMFNIEILEKVYTNSIYTTLGTKQILMWLLDKRFLIESNSLNGDNKKYLDTTIIWLHNFLTSKDAIMLKVIYSIRTPYCLKSPGYKRDIYGTFTPCVAVDRKYIHNIYSRLSKLILSELQTSIAVSDVSIINSGYYHYADITLTNGDMLLTEGDDLYSALFFAYCSLISKEIIKPTKTLPLWLKLFDD